ncbi:MAG: winged helix-turn-helix transcriptional regulator [Elusimicrobia bacterium]|nr:winged helix-turn-helix transcriptional regulator [Elusimicrobiota bacterium]MBU2615425.1 winged helix-turn-helix transcriptional regulator [Elusimicrobiota bacterium]
MHKTEISEKEFVIIKEISNNHLSHQRIISKNTGISLGLTNLIIRQLIKKGLIKAKQLNKRKAQYILTPKGFVEKAKKSYSYTLKTIQIIRSVKENTLQLITFYQEKGIKNFVILGKNELSEIVENVFKTIKCDDMSYSLLPDYDSSLLQGKENTLFLITENKNISLNNSVNLINRLSESDIFVNN